MNAEPDLQKAPEPATALGRSTASGFVWLMLQGLSGKFVGFFTQLLLAKLLLPEVFGQIGLAYTVGTLVGAFISFGIDDILLQRLRRMSLWVSPAFWSTLGFSVIGMLVMLAAAPLAAYLYGSPSLIGLIAVLAINLPLSALTTVPSVKLRASMNFRYLAVYASLELFAIQIASVVLAAIGWGAYSFIAPLPVAAIIKLIIFWRKAPTRITLRYRRAQIRYMMGSGFYVLGTRIISEVINQGDYIVLGLMATDAIVGIYFFAFRLAAQPLRMLAGNFGMVLFPALTQLGEEPIRQERAALQASRVLAYTVTPVCFMQAAVAAPVLHLMYGARWDGAIHLIQILSLGLPGDAVSWIAGALLIARRQFRRDFIYFCIFAPPFFALVILGAVLDSSTGVAIGVALYYALVKPINSWLVFRQGMRLADLIAIYFTPLLFAGGAVGSAYAISQLDALADSPLAQIAVLAAVAPLLYVAVLRVFAPATLDQILSRFPIEAVLRRMGRRLVRSRA